jgi:hypothetical protein
MQLQLAIYPEHTKLINSAIGFFSKDEFVYYLHNGSPIFCHSKEDRESYRYILATLVTTKLCTCTEISKALGINVKNVQRYVKTLKEQGTAWFFNREDHRGQCHKFTNNLKDRAQELINSGSSQQKVAKELGISEGAIRYHLRNGKLKKK